MNTYAASLLDAMLEWCNQGIGYDLDLRLFNRPARDTIHPGLWVECSIWTPVKPGVFQWMEPVKDTGSDVTQVVLRCLATARGEE